MLLIRVDLSKSTPSPEKVLREDTIRSRIALINGKEKSKYDKPNKVSTMSKYRSFLFLNLKKKRTKAKMRIDNRNDLLPVDTPTTRERNNGAIKANLIFVFKNKIKYKEEAKNNVSYAPIPFGLSKSNPNLCFPLRTENMLLNLVL